MIEDLNEEYWLSEIMLNSNLISQKIDENNDDRKKMSSEILIYYRHLLESIFCYICEHDKIGKEVKGRYNKIKEAIRNISTIAKFNWLKQLHDSFNSDIGHSSPFGEYAERIALKYYYSMIKIKNLLEQDYNIKILTNITKYPLDMDSSFYNYYQKINSVISNSSKFSYESSEDIVYVQKKKPIYCDGNLFFEYVFSSANDYQNKFDRFVVFSRIDVFDKYAIRATFIHKSVKMFNNKIDIIILINYKVAIRPCEFNKLSFIFGYNEQYSKTKEYNNLMLYIEKERMPLNEILLFNKSRYEKFLLVVFNKNSKTHLFNLFQIIREFSFSSSTNSGKNTILYLLYIMRNSVLKHQINNRCNEKVSNLYLKNGTIPFDEMPYGASLIRHNPKLCSLLDIFPYIDHEYEIVKRIVSEKSIENNTIYTNILEICEYDEIEKYIDKFNKKVPSYQVGRRIHVYNKNIFVEENEKNTIDVLRKILGYLKRENFHSYSNFAKGRINCLGITFSDPQKQSAVENMFEKRSAFFVYGAAGTGKSFLASYELNVLGDVKKLCLANTNSAVENMKRKINDIKAKYQTIYSYIKDVHSDNEYDILVLDECSTISTADICEILKKVHTKLILFLGDICQIESISFGNWFALAKSFIPKEAYVELTNQFRCENDVLKNFWQEVRNNSSKIQYYLNTYKISQVLDNRIFDRKYKDEIILCLNYDGLYGINNINKLLQMNNKNTPIVWKQYIFKKGDPILFTQNSTFKGILDNNLKGELLEIRETTNKLYFRVKINRVINSLYVCSPELECEGNTSDGKSIVSFYVNKFKTADYDGDTLECQRVPFQIAYAVSIHKAQGLEFDSVKIVLSNEIEENIDFNIFYTAITRAKKNLNIYWTPETENIIVKSLRKKDVKKDAYILASKFKDIKIIG